MEKIKKKKKKLKYINAVVLTDVVWTRSVSNAGVPWGQAPIKPLNEGCIIRQF